MRLPPSALVLACLVGLGTAAGAEARDRTLVPLAAPSDDGLPGAHPQRIIVKYRAGVGDCAGCRLGGSVPGSSSLDDLTRRFGVRDARSLFFEGEAGAAARGQAAARRFDDGRRRFATRAARAPQNAKTPDLSRIFVLELGKGADPAEAAAAFAADPSVEYAQPDYIVHANFVPNDPFWSSAGSVIAGQPDLWGLHLIDAQDAWDVSRGQGVVVAVIDTGVDRHPDIVPNLWVNPGEIRRNKTDDDSNGYVDDVYGWDFTVDRPATLRDKFGHGTHVAGTIAATGHNGFGVLGLAFGARIMSLPALDKNGVGYSSKLAKAIVYAADNGADVLNNSWGSAYADPVIADAVADAIAAGAVVVFSAGNSNSPSLGPASNPNVIAVAASQYDDTRAAFSNWGANVSVAAPGVNVLSLRGHGKLKGRLVGRRFQVLSGTSMAAPHVSGLAALLLSENPGLSADEVRWHLELNSDPIVPPGFEGQRWNPYFGWGRINAGRVFDAPPVTTRIASVLSLHGLAGDVEDGVTDLAFSFTTHAAPSWTLDLPGFLTAPALSGTGNATTSLGLDLRSYGAGTYVEPLVVDAPASTGGGTIPATMYAHAETRSGGEIVLSDQYFAWGPNDPVAVGSDGQGVLSAWVELRYGAGWFLVGTYTDDAGNVTGPFDIASENATFYGTKRDPQNIAIAHDGTSFMVAWVESTEQDASDHDLKTRQLTSVKAARVTRAGQVLGTTDIALDVEQPHRDGGFYREFSYLGIAFDGTSYTLVWRILDFDSSSRPFEVYLAKLAPNGTLLGAPVSLYSIANQPYTLLRPYLACVPGSCLLAWVSYDGERNELGLFVNKLAGRRFQGLVPLDNPHQLSSDIDWMSAIASSPNGYLATGWRTTKTSVTNVKSDVVVARIDANGVGTDARTQHVNLTPSGGYPYGILPSSASWDGQSYIVTWEDLGPASRLAECNVFAARVGPTGGAIAPEQDGFLLQPKARVYCGSPRLAPTATKSLLVWAEPGDGRPRRILAQGVLPR